MSRDSQRLHHLTRDQPVDVLLIKSIPTHTAASSFRHRLQPNPQVQFLPRQIRPSGSVPPTADRTLDLRQILSQPMADRPHSVTSLPFFRLALYEKPITNTLMQFFLLPMADSTSALSSQIRTAFPSFARLEAHWLLPSASLPSRGHSLSADWAGPRPERKRKKKKPSAHHHGTNT